MSILHPKLRQAFAKKKVLKVITGLDNFSLYDISNTVKAADIGGATYIDIAANIHIVKHIKQITNLPICVSSIDLTELYECVIEGVDLIEIGNFDTFYRKGINFSAKQIVELVSEAKRIMPHIDICVTVPHTFSILDQIELARNLEAIGVAILQTEGIGTKLSKRNIINSNVCKTISKASSALSSTYVLSNCVNIPIIASSGINVLSSPIAIYYGASAVGIGAAIRAYTTVPSMAMYINEIASSIGCSNGLANLKNDIFKRETEPLHNIL